MKKAVIIHGMPSKEEYLNPRTPCESNKHWIPWLQKQLLIKNVLAQTPEMPEPFYPTYDSWRNLFQQFEIDNETILVGHSCGGGFLLRYLSEAQLPVDTVALIAPWIDPNNSLQTGFFDFVIDENLLQRINRLIIFYSTDDDKEILRSVAEIKKHLPKAEYVEFTDKGHFVTESMETNSFPELLERLV